MDITCTYGAYKIIQTIKNRDELLILSEWGSLNRLFESSRIFLINKKKALFGVYLCKQECAQKIIDLMENIDYQDWDQLKPDSVHFLGSFIA